MDTRQADADLDGGHGLDLAAGGDHGISDHGTGVDRADAAPRPDTATPSDAAPPSDAAGDGTRPTVVSVSPADGAANVALRPTITLTFSEAMSPPSVNGRVMVDGVAAAGSWTWTSVTTYAFTPSADFGCSDLVQVTVDNGAADPSGLTMAASCHTGTGVAFCSMFTIKPTHEECQQCSDGCWDVKYFESTPACGCLGERYISEDPPPCSSADYCVGCGCENGCSCASICRYRREEKFHACSCGQVCS